MTELAPDVLAQPLSLRSGGRLANRLAKASMEEALGDASCDPTTELDTLYRRWAQGGAGLLLTGHVIVDRPHRARPRDVVLDGASDLGAFARWASSAASGSTQTWVQLNHCGRQTPRFVHAAPLAPSAVPAVKMLATFAKPVAMSEAEVEAVVDAFAFAARAAQGAGFAGVEIHAAHGYLLSQFLSPRTNLRTDRWGGSIENRSRLLIEVVRAVRAATGDHFGLGVKINAADFQRGGFDADDFAHVAVQLDREGIDVLEVSGGNYEAPVLLGHDGDEAPAKDRATERTRSREAYFLELARAVRGLVEVPLMLTGGMRSRAGMEQARAEGIDVVGIARPLAVDPTFAARILARETDGIAMPRLDVPRRLGALADASWYALQLARMGRGLDPDRDMSAWSAMLRYVGQDLLQAMTTSKRSLAPVSRGGSQRYAPPVTEISAT
jgi:2,4-dienoyl-CoA reductase-like NADH-dependent reductase (Old Yellow Enzyme family)